MNANMSKENRSLFLEQYLFNKDLKETHYVETYYRVLKTFFA